MIENNNKLTTDELEARHYRRMLRFLTADSEGRSHEEYINVLEQTIKAAQELLKEHK